MKKVWRAKLSLLLAGGLLVGTLSGCAGQTSASGSAAAATEPTPVKTGISVVADLGSSQSAVDGKDGKAQTNITLVAVTVDENGVIDDCVIDVVQAKVGFDGTGKITSDLVSPVLSKQELQEDYGMKQASGIGKEWYEQAVAIEEYVKGKTAQEVSSIKMDDVGHATDADLASSATIKIGDYVEGIVNAAENAQSLGAQRGDELHLSTVTTIASSTDASAEKDGTASSSTTIAAVTLRDGAITSCALDVLQSKVNFSAAGEIKADLAASPLSKNQLKEDYGMKSVSGIGKEWYEQAAAFAEYVTGKTPDEVAGIALDDSGHATDADLTSSATISVSAFVEAIRKAAQ